MRLETRVLAGLIAFAALATSAAAGDYYAGKTIDLLIGAPPGGGYDIYARALARHYGRHIPGQPSIVAKNMPGAGSARAAGFISTMAPRDGTAIAAIMPGAVMGPLLDEKVDCSISAPPITARASASRARAPRSRPSTTRARRRRPSAAAGPTIRLANTASCSRKPRARYTTWFPATAAPPRSRWRWSAARSRARAAGT